jgi:hypothetical protein
MVMFWCEPNSVCFRHSWREATDVPQDWKGRKFIEEFRKTSFLSYEKAQPPEYAVNISEMYQFNTSHMFRPFQPSSGTQLKTKEAAMHNSIFQGWLHDVMRIFAQVDSSVLWGNYGVGEGDEFSDAVPCGGTRISRAFLSRSPPRYVSHFQTWFRRSDAVRLVKHTSRAEVQRCIAVTTSSTNICCITIQNIEDFMHCRFSVEKYVDGPLRYSYG